MRRVLTIDIEVLWNRIDKIDTLVQKGSSPIQIIGLHDSYKDKYYAFFYHKNVKIVPETEIKDKTNRKLFKTLCNYFKTKNFVARDGKFISTQSGNSYPCRFFLFNNEKLMINFYMRFVKDNNPDIWHGFFAETFDLPYIINRCKATNINFSYMSPLRNVYISHGYAEIRGSVVWDIPKLYAHYQGSHRFKNSLKRIAETHLNISKTSDRIVDEDWYDNDWDKFINYCLTDVELCVLLEKQLGLIKKADRFEKFSGVNPKFVLFDSHIIESIFSFIRVIYEKEILKNEYKIAFDTRKKGKMERSAGAIVLPSKTGFYRKGVIIALDVSKMYPEIIKTLNISVETLQKIVEESEKYLYNYCKENNVYYKKEPVGFIPFAFDFFFKLRKEFEDERDKHEYGTKEYNEKNDVRQTVKDTVNAVTGQFDKDDSPFLKPEIANSYRLTGQKEIKTGRDYVLIFGNAVGVDVDVLYGDTDSIFVWLKTINDIDVALKIGKEIIDWIQYGFDKYAKELNVDKHNFVIALEKVLDIFVSIGKKKKYFGHIRWADGKYIKEESSLLIKGYESRRSDSSVFTDKAQKEIFSLINSTRQLGWEKVRKKILYKLRIEYPKEFTDENMLEIGIPKGLQKPFNKYKITNPHLDGCGYANRYLGGQFGAGSKPKLIYIREVKKNSYGLPPTNALCIEDGMKIPKDVFVIDKQKMIEKTVFAKLEKTLNVVGIEREEITNKTRRKTLFDFQDKYLSNKKEEIKELESINKENLDKYIKKSKLKLKELIKNEDKSK